jgi:L-ascorbate metabolism protein UlaG (beta-lactamase superfamily)
MNLIFLAHASFLIITSQGTKIITDPYLTGSFNNALSYKPIKESADVVLVSHEHSDHNAVSEVLGNPKIIKGDSNWTFKDVKVTGIASYHDTQKGTARGKNTIFVIEADSLRIVHLGDLGYVLSKEECAKIGKVDVLLSPVGGYFTIDSKAASEIMNSLKPSITIPMHYKTEVLDFPIAKVDEFIKAKKNVKNLTSSEIEISKETLPKSPEIWVLKMAKE